MRRLRRDMYACGEAGLPKQIVCEGIPWQLDTVFKHDFFACTGRYRNEHANRRIVLKISRLQSFLGIPCAWIGHFLRNREIDILRQLDDLDQVPQTIKTFGRNGLVYRYIKGHSLDEKPDLPDDFFDQLQALLTTIHQRKICYMDLNKRGNILVGEDGRPYVIDFQISLCMPARWCNRLRGLFQQEDLYHLLKHKRKLRPDLLTQDEAQSVKKPSLLIRIHRAIARPFQKIRRPILRYLYQKNILNSNPDSERSPENDPGRFLN
ncbi:MAG: hypothetical protein ACYS72_03655 [Planctomycetota bacterium]